MNPFRFWVAIGIAGCVGLGGSPSLAEPLKPLYEVINTKADDSYFLVRCAAFYAASGEWVDARGLPGETVENPKESVRDFAAYAIFTRSMDGHVSLQSTMPSVTHDISTIKGQYLRRFDKNFKETGHGFANDKIWTVDHLLCESLLPTIQAALKKIEKR